MENILLRFRDTENIDTIEEHKKVINLKGYTLWGWWKKDSEPDRLKKLIEMKEKISGYKFYLFDRSTDRFFILSVSDLIFDGTEKLRCPEPAATPHYYNQEKLSLWLKVDGISTIDKEDFLRVFKIIPSVDFTFFTEADVQTELAEIKKSKRVRLKSDYILHLSDIHFGADFGFPATSAPNNRSLIDILTDYVKNSLRKEIGLLIISGDITSRGDVAVLLSRGLEFLNQLCTRLSIDKESVIIIPGNHDIPLQDVNFTNYSHENLFKLFLEQFYGKVVEPFGINFYEFPCGKKVDILRIHSVKLRKKEESNYGYVDWHHYENFLSAHTLDGDIKMAVIHHHLVSMPAEEILDPSYPYGSISVTIDSGRVINGLQKKGFHFVLNGHQHIPGISVIKRGIVDDDNVMDMKEGSPLTILSAGSAGVKGERFSIEMPFNSFSIYLMKPDFLEVEVKAYNPAVDPKRHYASKLFFDQS